MHQTTAVARTAASRTDARRARMAASALATGALLAALGAMPTRAHAAAPQVLSEREMSNVYGQGLSGPTLEALTTLDQNRQWSTSADASGVAPLGGYAGLAALSADNGRNLDQRLAVQQLQLATTGLQNSMALVHTMGEMAQMTANVPLVIPVLNIPFLFGIPMPLPVALPPPKNDQKGGH